MVINLNRHYLLGREVDKITVLKHSKKKKNDKLIKTINLLLGNAIYLKGIV